MDYANKKIYPHFTDVQHYMEQVKDYCDRKGFRPEAVIKLDGSEIFDVIASDTFGLDIQSSRFDKKKRLLVVGGITTPLTIGSYIKAGEQPDESSENILVTSMFHRLNISEQNPEKMIIPHFTGNNLFNDEHIVFPWQIWSSMREDMKNGLNAFSPNYYEVAPDITVNKGTPEEVTKCLVPWQNVELLCEEVYRYLKTTGKKPDAVFGASRGGYVYAQAISDYLGIPWSAKLWHNMIYTEAFFDSGKTAEKIGDYKQIITVAMNYRAGKSAVIPDICLTEDRRLACNPHERYHNGFTSRVVRTYDKEQLARALAESRRQRIEEREGEN
jgi:hypothetical protein